MKKEQLYNGIGLSSTAQEFVDHFQMDEVEYQEWKKLFFSDMKAFLQKGKEEGEAFSQKALVLSIRLALEVYDDFLKAGFTEEFYFLNMKDIAVWNRTHEKLYGVPGLKEIGWVGMSIRQKLYRIGRLQFEPYEVENDIEACGKLLKKGSKVLNVHIPEDGKMDPDTCEMSFRKAAEFFKRRGYEGANIFICESWLLSPRLKEVLENNSNIIKFQDRFEIYGIIYPFRQAEERIFGYISEDKSSYPEVTRLQKAAKESLLKDPSDFGMGMGIFYL